MSLNSIFDLVEKLSSVQRFSQSKLTIPESVLEHSGAVCIYANLIGFYLKKEFPDIEIDFAELNQKAIFHDIDEFETGDIARPVKYFSKEIREIIGEMEYAAVKRLDKSMDMDRQLLEIWCSAKTGLTGFIICICDKLAVLHKCHEEIHFRGNLKMKKYCNREFKESLEEVIEEFQKEIKQEHGMESEFLGSLKTEINSIIVQIFQK